MLTWLKTKIFLAVHKQLIPYQIADAFNKSLELNDCDLRFVGSAKDGEKIEAYFFIEKVRLAKDIDDFYKSVCIDVKFINGASRHTMTFVSGKFITENDWTIFIPYYNAEYPYNKNYHGKLFFDKF